MNRVVKYSWNEKTEIGTFEYEDGQVRKVYQPLHVDDVGLRDSYFVNLLVWLRLDNRL